MTGDTIVSGSLAPKVISIFRLVQNNQGCSQLSKNGLFLVFKL